jgi:2-polyprenyl-6-hydroxyphenyl methylase/3-demethylubiquinone-9 3-methyltransferase
VGPRLRVQTPARDQPLRLGWIDGKAALPARRCSTSAAAAASWPNPWPPGAEVTGIDLSEKALSVARLHLFESGHKVDYRHISAEDSPRNAPASFDVVTCMEMLEHVPDPASTIAACARLVKPGGHVFFSTLNRNLKSYLFAVIGAEYVLNCCPAGTHEYAKFIKPSELSRHCRNARTGRAGDHRPVLQPEHDRRQRADRPEGAVLEVAVGLERAAIRPASA